MIKAIKRNKVIRCEVNHYTDLYDIGNMLKTLIATTKVCTLQHPSTKKFNFSKQHLSCSPSRIRQRGQRNLRQNAVANIVLRTLSIMVATAVLHASSKVEMIGAIGTGVAPVVSPYRAYLSSVIDSNRERRRKLFENNYLKERNLRGGHNSVVGRQLFLWDLIFPAPKSVQAPVKSPPMTRTPTSTTLRPRPSRAPTGFPTETPTKSPVTKEPTQRPTKNPTDHPTQRPSSSPTSFPTPSPTNYPTQRPSSSPTDFPSRSPSSVPTDLPSAVPSMLPSTTPSKNPSYPPTESPTASPLDALLIYRSHDFRDFSMTLNGTLPLPFLKEDEKLWEMVTADHILDQLQNNEGFQKYEVNDSLDVKIDLGDIESVEGGRRLQTASSHNFIFRIYVSYNVAKMTSSNDFPTDKSCYSIILDAFDSKNMQVYLQNLRNPPCDFSKDNCHSDDEEGASSPFAFLQSAEITKNSALLEPIDEGGGLPYINVAGVGCVGIILISFYAFYAKKNRAARKSSELPDGAEETYSHDREEWMDDRTIRDMDEVGERPASGGMLGSLHRRLSGKHRRLSGDLSYTANDAEPAIDEGTFVCQGTVAKHGISPSVVESMAGFSLQGVDYISECGSVGSGDQDVASSPPIKKDTFDLYTRARKLGIIIHSPNPKNGPIIHTVKDSSPFFGKVNVGDRVVAIDDKDTTQMSSDNVLKIIQRKNKKNDIKFTFMREAILLPEQQLS